MTAERRPPDRLDPDPRHVPGPEADLSRRITPEYVAWLEDIGASAELVAFARRAMRDRETRDEQRSGRGLVAVLAFAWILAVVAILSIALLLIATPRADPDAPRSPAALTAPGLPSASRSGFRVSEYASDYSDPVTAAAAARYAGTATWYCGSGSPCTSGYGPDDLVAAIDTDLGIAKGSTVVVRAFGKSVTVVVRDVCACPGERLIDLTSGAFRRLAPLDYGVIPVTIEVVDGSATLPPTDVDGVQ